MSVLVVSANIYSSLQTICAFKTFVDLPTILFQHCKDHLHIISVCSVFQNVLKKRMKKRIKPNFSRSPASSGHLNTGSLLWASRGCNQQSGRLIGPQLLSWPLSCFIKAKQSRSYRSVNTHHRSPSSTSAVSLQQRALSWLPPLICHCFYCWGYVMKEGEPGCG